jgi:VWFA-related protein
MLLRFATLLLAAAAGSQDTAVFRTNVSLVHIDAEVVQDGRTLTGFAKTDFRVLDEGKEQPVLNFSAEEQPLDIILLFDISGSMQAIVAGVGAAAQQGLQELRQGDRVAVMVFNSRSWLVADFTENLDAVQRTIQQDVMSQPFGGGTLIQSAVDDAAAKFLHEPRTERRRAVLIITDNIGTRTRREETVVRDFWEADALLSGLIIQNKAFATMHTVGTIMSPTSLIMQAGMKGIADKTGGDAIHSEDPGAAFEDMMRRIRTRYSLYYAMPNDKPGKQRTVRVELAKAAGARYPKAVVRARKGYVIPASAR